MEVWKHIIGFKSFYEVSNFGNIRRLERKVNIRNNKYMKSRVIKAKNIKKLVGKRGYFLVTLCKNGIPVKKPVHFFVTQSFLGNRKKGLHVNHKDANKLNNRIENLEYITPSENLSHARSLGLIVMRKGERANSKLTKSKVLSIRKEFSEGKITKKDLGDKYNIHPSHIGRIISKRYWDHI